MDTFPQEPKETIHWSELYAFGLPSGSIRSILALAIVATAGGIAVLRPNEEIPSALRDLMFLMLGHYFAVRKHAQAAPEIGPPPLFLPRGSIRFLMLASFLTVAILLIRGGRPVDLKSNSSAYTMVLVAAFLLGWLSSLMTVWMTQRGHRPHRFFADLRATVALLALGVLILISWNQVFHFLPIRDDPLNQARIPFSRYGIEYILSAVVGFYFGARS